MPILTAPAAGGTAARKVAAAPARRQPWAAILTAAVALLGLCILLYPSTAAWVSQLQQSEVVNRYSQAVTGQDSVSSENAVQLARAYNEFVTGGGQVAAGVRVPVGSGSGAAPYDYNSLLEADSTGLMARLKIPSIGVDLPIYHGTSDATLELGIGHLEGSSLPIGGLDTHAVLTGHRGLASAELFTHLDRMRVGDTFTIEVFGQVLSYQVVSTHVVEPDQTESLFPQAGKDLVTLVTCTPLGINSQRILVTGERILPTPVSDVQQAGERSDLPGFPWWLVWLSTGVVLIGAYLWWNLRLAKPRGGYEGDSDGDIH